MDKVYAGNAFSLQMLANSKGTANWEIIDREQLEAEMELYAANEVISCFGHEDIAAIASHQANMLFTVNRVSVKLNSGDTLYVAQYVGQRLPEGTKQLPEGAEIRWFRVTID